MKNPEIYQIDAFTNEPFNGNPAGVTFGDGLSKNEMQIIAREMNLAETAFISKSDKADFKLQWFTPAVEVNLCGHATIASLHFLTEKNILKDNNDISFETRSGILKCRRENDTYFMQIPIFRMSNFNGNKNDILEALALNKNDIDEKIPFMLSENKYLYIYVKSLAALGNIHPEYKKLKKISETKNEFEAVALFTLETKDKKNFAHGRFFAPFYGIDEDPVTGSMNGPLLLVLQELGFIDKSATEITKTFEQGDFIGRKGRVTVSFNKDKNELYIAGNAVTVLKGVLNF